MKGVIIMEHREQVEAGQAPQLRMIARVEHAKKHPPAGVKSHVQACFRSRVRQSWPS